MRGTGWQSLARREDTVKTGSNKSRILTQGRVVLPWKRDSVECQLASFSESGLSGRRRARACHRGCEDIWPDVRLLLAARLYDGMSALSLWPSALSGLRSVRDATTRPAIDGLWTRCTRYRPFDNRGKRQQQGWTDGTASRLAALVYGRVTKGSL